MRASDCAKSLAKARCLSLGETHELIAMHRHSAISACRMQPDYKTSERPQWVEIGPERLGSEMGGKRAQALDREAHLPSDYFLQAHR